MVLLLLPVLGNRRCCLQCREHDQEEDTVRVRGEALLLCTRGGRRGEMEAGGIGGKVLQEWGAEGEWGGLLYTWVQV